MSRRWLVIRLSRWRHLRIIIDPKIKIIRVMPIPGEVKFIIKNKKRIIVLLRIVKIVLEGLAKLQILKIQISCPINLGLS